MLESKLSINRPKKMFDNNDDLSQNLTVGKCFVKTFFGEKWNLKRVLKRVSYA